MVPLKPTRLWYLWCCRSRKAKSSIASSELLVVVSTFQRPGAKGLLVFQIGLLRVLLGLLPSLLLD
jgi:hypothetical protein